MEAMKNELTCPICLQLYNSPVGLPCSHSACLGCVQSLLFQNTQRCDTASVDSKGDKFSENGSSNFYSLSCPVCNDTVSAKMDEENVLSQLPTNKLLQNIVDRYRAALEQVGVNGDSNSLNEAKVQDDVKLPDCDMCEDEEEGPQVATKWCSDCTVLYCDKCFAQCHRMKGPFATHTIKSPPPSAARNHLSCNDLNSSGRQKGLPSLGAMSSDVLKCDIHDDEKINMYCIACDQLICALCKLVGEHKEHEVNDLNTCYKLKQDTLARNCDKLIETSLSLAASMEKLKNAQHDFTESKVSTEEQLNECFEDLERFLAKRKEALFKQLSAYYNVRLKDVDETSEAVKNNLDAVHSLLSFTNEAMKETDQISFLQSSNLLCKRVLDACEQGAAMEKKCAAFELLENSEDENNGIDNRRLYVDFAREKSILKNLNFLKPPGAVKVEPSFCVSKPNSLIIRWNNNTLIPVSEYHVIYRPRGDEDWISCPGLEVQGIDESKEEIDAEDEQRNDTSFVGGPCELCIDELEADTEYEVCVIAVNMAGQSPDENNSVFLRTSLPVPKTPIVDEDDCVVEKNSILFKWTSDLTLATSSQSSGNISSNTAASKSKAEECMVSFVVEYKKESSSIDSDSADSEHWNCKRHMESTELTLCDLAYNTVYLIRVKAVSSTGSSDFSETVALTTWPLPPETPVILEEHCRGQGNKYQLQWTCPENGQGGERDRVVDSYTVEYRPMQRGNDWVAYEGIGVSHCHLKDLLYDTEYSVRVKALNISGESDYSDSIIIKTGSPPIKFSMDVETAHVNLKMTSNSSIVYDRAGAKSRNAGQFSFIGASFSVLGDKSVLRGKHYWEAKVKTKGSDRIGIAYQSTARDSLIGDSEKSWAVGFLASEDGKLFCYHNRRKKRLSVEIMPSMKSVTFGILLDLDDGYVAFFLTELNQHLHSFKVNFSEPVYPAFSAWPADIQVNSGLPVPDSLLL